METHKEKKEIVKSYTYPKSIPVGGYTFTIEFKDACHTNSSAPHMADTWVDGEAIRIATRTASGEFRTLSVLEETFLHEAFHAINETWGCGLTEEQVEGMAQGWLQVMHSLGHKIITEK